MEKHNAEIEAILIERFGKDNLISLATCADNIPYVRTVNSYYEKSAFYVLTYALSGKMQQIRENPRVAISGDWFTAHGIGENLGYFGAPENTYVAKKMREVFAEWINNGHNNFDDLNTCILKIKLSEGVLFDHGTRYDIDFYDFGGKMTDLSYRPAVEGDLPFIIDIYNRNIEALHGELRSFERWLEIFHSGSEYYIVENSEAVAWFRIDVEDEILDLAMVQVSPEHQRMGIGRFIVESFEKIAREKVFHNLVIHTTEDNIPAKNLYLKCGYEITEFDECTTADGATRMGYTFEKHI